MVYFNQSYVNLKHFINFNNKINQRFAFPKDVIDHISIHCNLQLSQKLMSSCKHLRILQINLGFAHVYRLEVGYSRFFYVWLNPVNVVYPILFKNLKGWEFKSIKVWNELTIGSYGSEMTTNILKIVDNSEISKLHYWQSKNPSHSYNINDFLQPNIKRLMYENSWHTDSGFIRLIFNKFDKLTQLRYNTPQAQFNAADLKALINIQRSTKFMIFILGVPFKIDFKADLLFQLADTHMDVNGHISITFDKKEEPKKFEIFYSDFVKILAMRRDNKISTCPITFHYTNRTHNFCAVNENGFSFGFQHHW